MRFYLREDLSESIPPRSRFTFSISASVTEDGGRFFHRLAQKGSRYVMAHDDANTAVQRDEPSSEAALVATARSAYDVARASAIAAAKAAAGIAPATPAAPPAPPADAPKQPPPPTPPPQQQEQQQQEEEEEEEDGRGQVKRVRRSDSRASDGAPPAGVKRERDASPAAADSSDAPLASKRAKAEGAEEEEAEGKAGAAGQLEDGRDGMGVGSAVEVITNY